MKLKERAEKLANEHWEYMESLLNNEYVQFCLDGVTSDEHVMNYIEKVGFHYRSAAIHFYKHGVQDALRVAKAMEMRGKSWP